MTRFLLPLIAVLSFFTPAMGADTPSEGRFVLSGWGGPSINVYFVEPAEITPDMPVIFVMHGVRRNADEYAANWRDIVQEHNVRVYAPEFTARKFPGAEQYNLGGIGTGKPSAYGAIEPLFAAAKARAETNEVYVLFGHSAGAQFVHRAVAFEPLPGLRMAIAANAGWYTMPDMEQTWPYGFSGIEGSGPVINRWLGQPLHLLLGDQDNDPNARNLRRTEEADRQGTNRFDRGHSFYRAAESVAAARGVPFNWRLSVVPGIAHDNAGMALGALPIILSGDSNTEAD